MKMTVWRQVALDVAISMNKEIESVAFQRMRSQEEGVQAASREHSGVVAAAFVELPALRSDWQEVAGGADDEDAADSFSHFSLRVQQELEQELDLADTGDNPVAEIVESERVEAVEALPSQQLALNVQELQDVQRRRRQAQLLTASSDSLAASQSMSHIPPHQPAERQRTILQRTAYLYEFVKQRQPSWSEEMVRMAAAGLTVYRTRYQDLFVRDYVTLLWIMEGERYLRSHNSTCYLYHEHSAFEAFRGIPPESTFAHIKP